MILFQIVIVSSGTHLVKNHESQSRTNESAFKKKKTSPKLKMLGPLRNQTVNLKTDSKTLYYSILKFIYSPSILKHNKGWLFRISQKPHPIIVYNYHRNYMNGTFRTTNTQSCSDQSIDLCVLWDACHELFCTCDDFYASGAQDTEVTKSLESHCSLPRPAVK